MKPLKFSDAVLIIPIILILAGVLLHPICIGWADEGSMTGTCSPAFFTGLYGFLMSALLFFAFTGFIWIPVYIVFYTLSTIGKVRLLKSGGTQALRENLAATIIWTLATALIVVVILWLCGVFF
ncbi:hypothetical protein BH11PAT2_BH11PAT2_00320 [soil metagenome]